MEISDARRESAVSSGMVVAVVKDECTSRVRRIFCLARRITSEANCSPGDFGDGEELCCTSSLGSRWREVHWAQLVTVFLTASSQFKA